MLPCMIHICRIYRYIWINVKVFIFIMCLTKQHIQIFFCASNKLSGRFLSGMHLFCEYQLFTLIVLGVFCEFRDERNFPKFLQQRSWLVWDLFKNTATSVVRDGHIGAGSYNIHLSYTPNTYTIKYALVEVPLNCCCVLLIKSIVLWMYDIVLKMRFPCHWYSK